MLIKILVVAVVIAIAWYLFRTVTRPRPRKPSNPPAVEQAVKCPTCGTYVPAATATNCGRDACPYRLPGAGR